MTHLDLGLPTVLVAIVYIGLALLIIVGRVWGGRRLYARAGALIFLVGCAGTHAALGEFASTNDVQYLLSGHMIFSMWAQLAGGALAAGEALARES